MAEGLLLSRTGTLTREQLALIPTPQATATHRPIPHVEVIGALVETLGFRHIGVVEDQYAVDKTGMKMWGTLDLDTSFHGCRFSLAVRNSHDKSMRLAMVVGYKVFCCDNGAFSGDFEPVLAKHSKNFAPMVQQVDRWRESQLSDTSAKLLIYRAFVEAEMDLPHHLDRKVHGHYFNPQHEEFQPRTLWSLSNAFTSAFKELDPIPRYKATAALAEFLNVL